MAIKIASWNVEGRLSGYVKNGRGSAEHILQGIEELDADIVILPEAYLEESDTGVDERLKDLGYEWRDVEYGYDERDWSKEYLGKIPHLRVLSRLTIADVQEEYWGGLRPMLSFIVRDPATGAEVRIFATHLDDRSEQLREQQIDDAIPILQKTKPPKIMVGDFNAMWPSGRARLLGSQAMRFIAKHIPHTGLRYTATRLTDMATGHVLQRVANEAGLRDADSSHKATTTPKMRDILYAPSVRLAQIDHMMVSDEIVVRDFMVSADGGSDHRAISAVLDVKRG